MANSKYSELLADEGIISFLRELTFALGYDYDQIHTEELPEKHAILLQSFLRFLHEYISTQPNGALKVAWQQYISSNYNINQVEDNSQFTQLLQQATIKFISINSVQHQ